MPAGSSTGADLRGIKVLVVDDAFYLAMEIKEQIERAGGTVLGPCRDVSAAIALLEAHPDCATVDVNLGQGASFAIAEALADQGVPFLFLTGYDPGAFPRRFAHIEHIQKPAVISRVIDAVARLPLSGAE